MRATDGANKTMLETAGTVILAQAEDFTPGTFLGFFFSSAASLVMMAVMLQCRVFDRWICLAGLVGTALLLFFTISATFIPAIFGLAMLLALLGGLLMMAWNILVGLDLFRRAGAPSSSSQSQNAHSLLLDCPIAGRPGEHLHDPVARPGGCERA